MRSVLERSRTRWNASLPELALLFADGHFVCLSEFGDLSLFNPNPAKYDEVSRVELPLEAPCWAPPVLSRGLLYVRGKGKLLALELIAPKK